MTIMFRFLSTDLNAIYLGYQRRGKWFYAWK